LRHLPEVLQSRKRDRRWKISSSFYDFALRIWISKVLAIFLLKYLILKELLINNNYYYFQLTREERTTLQIRIHRDQRQRVFV
jgi:hypothetical protein